MKAYVTCEASGSLFVRIPLCLSVSAPFSRLHPPGPWAVSQEQEQKQVRAPESGDAGPHAENQAGPGRSPRGLDGTSLETEAECLRSICHYGNRVARPFFPLLFLLRFHYLMQMRPQKKPFFRVAHAGTSPIQGFIAASASRQLRNEGPRGEGFRSSHPALEHTASCQTSPQILPVSQENPVPLFPKT